MGYLRQLKITLVKGEFKNPLNGQIQDAHHIYCTFKDIGDWAKETIIGIYLNEKFEIRTYSTLALGAKNIVRLPHHEIFEQVIMTRSQAFILVHNHPNGDPTPSGEDRKRIKELQEQSIVLKLKFVDFIIIGDDAYWSMSMENSTSKGLYNVA